MSYKRCWTVTLQDARIHSVSRQVIWFWWMVVLLHIILEGSQLWLCAHLWLKQLSLLNLLLTLSTWKLNCSICNVDNIRRQWSTAPVFGLTTQLPLQLLLEMTLCTRLWSRWQSRFVSFKSAYIARSSWSCISRPKKNCWHHDETISWTDECVPAAAVILRWISTCV